MSRDPGQGRSSSPWSAYNHGQNNYQQQQQQKQQYQAYEGIASSSTSPLAVATDISSNYYGHSAPPTTESPSRLPERTDVPTRSSTAPSADSSRNLAPNNGTNNPTNQYSNIPASRSDDLNHGSVYSSNLSSSPRPSPQFFSSAIGSAASRPNTPGTSATTATTQTREPSSSGHSDHSHNHTSATSHSEASTNSKVPSSSSAAGLSSLTCSACGKPMQGPFVRALGSVFHLNCFKCMDCGEVVASKFFPIDVPNSKQQPLCERDYFRRLNLICAKCGMALRGSYITACNKKFHVEHFTCSLCSTLFGPQDSYYEHDGDVYCHFHYSTRFATKCAGCSSAILKQFVEINRNMRDECWHPECYMINKFWNVKVTSRRPTSAAEIEGGAQEPPAYVEEEARDNPTSLRDKQVRMEQQVYRIWTVLSAFEESSAACISDMLRQVSNGAYLDAIRMAEKFILHVEVLFGAIDDLEFHFATMNMKGMSHVREARMLCRKTVELFTLLSHTQETGARRMGMTQELLALVTGLAHYLKILIRIALTGALKLEREQSVRDAMSSFLDKLHLLAVQGANPTAKRLIKGSHGEPLNINPHSNIGTQGVTYGFRSLAPENAGDSPFSQLMEGGSSKMSSSPPSDLCVRCGVTVEEDCVRLGTYQRWHSHCIQCAQCGKFAAVPVPKEQQQPIGGQGGPVGLSGSGSGNGSASKSGDERDMNAEGGGSQRPKLTSARRPPANVNIFVYDAGSMKETASFGEVPTLVLCTDHAHQGCRTGFQAVQRLEQYAFLLNVALRRLYLLLKQQGVVPLSPASTSSDQSSDPYRNSDIGRMKPSVHLDRKLSATARLPKRSTIVESPAGRTVHPTDLKQQQQYDAQYYQNNGGQMQQAPVGVYQQHQLQPGPQAHHPQQPVYTPMSPQPTFQSSSSPPSQNNTPRAIQSKLPSDSQALKPSLQRKNTEVMIVDDNGPSSPATEENGISQRADDVLTLADIPQWVEVAQAREQQRSLPRESSTPYIAELTALELAIVKHCAVLMLTRSPLKEQFDLDEMLEMVEMKKAGFWGKLFKGDNKKSVKKKGGVFGVPLELLVEREGSDSLLGATGATLRVPSFIDDVISAMRQMDMSVEGIFRKNGNIRRLRELTEAIDRDPASVDLTQDNPVQLAALLKKFLRDLPDPLMTYKLHRLFIASQSLQSEEDRKRHLHLVALLLPKAHRDTMEVLFAFLKWVASFAHKDAETGSKMDLGNLATVICPSILCARGKDAVRDETFSGLRVITSLLENQDEFFTVPEDFVSLLHDQDYFANLMELPSKDFMKKCDTYMRLKSGRPTPGTPFMGQSNGQPRYPISAVTSPNGAPPPGSPFTQPPSQTPRIPQSDSYAPPSSPNMGMGMQQGIMQAMQQRPPQMEEWNSPQAPSRPSTSNGPPLSRPASYVGPRPAPQPPGQSQSYNSGMNGYPGSPGHQR